MKKYRKIKRKLVIVTGALMLLFAGAIKQPAMTAYAAEPGAATTAQTQASVQALGSWEKQADGTWRVRATDGSGYILNQWYQDADGSWYYLNANGAMFAGIVVDDAKGKSYLLNTDQTQAYGSYGKMLTVDGAYTICGVTVNLTFNHLSDGTNGAITSQEGLSALTRAGVPVLHINTPAGTSASGTNTTNGNGNGNGGTSGATQTQTGATQEVTQETNQETTQTDNGGDSPFGAVGGSFDTTPGGRTDPNATGGWVNRVTQK